MSRSPSRHAVRLLPFIKVVIILPVATIAGCSGIFSREAFNAEIVMKSCGTLQCADPFKYDEHVLDYFRYYGLEGSENRIEHFFGTFKSGEYKLAGHVLRPQNYTATVIVIHGYLNHCGTMNRIADHLLKQGYAVGMYDLPGHGLSDGKRGAIDDFSEYGQSLDDFLNTIPSLVHGPYHVIGFSTGGSAVLDYLLIQNHCDHREVEKVVFVAPLVKSRAAEIGSLCVPFGSIPRAPFPNSSDYSFFWFINFKDRLQVGSIPASWLKAAVHWREQILRAPGCRKSVKVIQGTQDMVVDWKYNVEFMKSKFAAADVVLLKHGGHQLLNEADEVRYNVFAEITDYLSN
jgi:alpha-beta hydrolase superfamily lysophospholipase